MLEQKIINYRYFKEFTQSETAKILGMSQVKVSRSEKKCLSKMYNYLNI
jgi:RNA polymerase sporulation-specific sigma factor